MSTTSRSPGKIPAARTASPFAEFRGGTTGEDGPHMGSMTSGDLLALPVRMHGIDLGRAVEHVRDGEIAIGSPLTLLDELAFYRARGHGLGALRGARVANAGGELGTLRDIVFDAGGPIRELVVATSAGERRFPQGAGVRIASRVSAA